VTFPSVRLEECARIVSGATPSTSKPELWDGDILWATPADLSKLDGPFIGETPRTITAEGLASCAAEVLPSNSVLFSSRAPIGHVAINTVPMATNQGFKSFIPAPEKLDAGYLFHWLCANRSYLEGLGNGATFKEVSKAAVSRIEIPLPPLDEQRRIAAILDQADGLRRRRREAMGRLDVLYSSISAATFGTLEKNDLCWPEDILSGVVRDGTIVTYGIVQAGDEYEGGVPYIRTGDIVDGEIRCIS